MNRIITLEELKAEIQKQGSNLTFDESIELDMTELPDGIQSITVKGDLAADKLTKLPEGITIDSSGWFIALDGLSTISNVTIKAGSSLFLDNITSIDDEVVLKADNDIHLKSLATIGNNVTIEVHIWHLYLSDKLTAIGNNVIIKADENIKFNEKDTGLTEITLTDDEPISDKVKQFLIDKKITVRCSESSPLVNLAFDSVKVEIVA